jgi:HK97 gp10 family phage protein
MGNYFKVEFHGDKQIKKFLGELPPRIIKKSMRRALSIAATPIVKMARALAPKQFGWLKRSIKRKVKTYPSGVTVAVIGPDRNVVGKPKADLGSGKDVKVKRRPLRIPHKYAHLVEGGHAGPHPARPHRFLAPAYAANATKAVAAARKVLLETFKAEAVKLKAKAKKG